GALGFALQAVGVRLKASWLHVDAVAAAFEMWGGSQSDAALAAALSTARSRFGRYLPPPIPPALESSSSADAGSHRDPGAVRLLTVHSPYAVPLCLTAQLDHTRRLSLHARNTLTALAGCDLRLNSGVAGLPIAPSISPQEPIEILTDLGLVNEWVGAAAFVLQDPDLVLIAKRAEAWRRTIAGHWAYARAPRDCAGAEFAGGLDALLWVRGHELLAVNDPVGTSRLLLAAWSGTERALGDKIRKRLATLVARVWSARSRARRDARALDAARLLARAGTPSAFIPALATLVAFNGRLERGKS